MDILFMGDYSGFHSNLATALEKRGHKVHVVSNGSGYMNTACHTQIKRSPGMKGSMVYLYNIMSLMGDWKGHDLVELINPHFLELRPGKINYIFNRLRDGNCALGLSMCGTDHFYVRAMLGDDLLRYSEFQCGGNPTPFAINREDYTSGWLSPAVKIFDTMVYENVDGATTALYEYHKVAEKYMKKPFAYTGIGVDCATLPFKLAATDEKINIFLGAKPEYRLMKGMDILERAIEKIAERNPGKFEITRASGLSLHEYLRRMSHADVVVDQLYSYTPATNALQAMALGKVAVSGGEEEYYDFIGEKELRPIINVDPTAPDLEEALEKELLDRDALQRRSLQGREFVEKHNDINVVAARFEKHWEQILDSK